MRCEVSITPTGRPPEKIQDMNRLVRSVELLQAVKSGREAAIGMATEGFKEFVEFVSGWVVKKSLSPIEARDLARDLVEILSRDVSGGLEIHVRFSSDSKHTDWDRAVYTGTSGRSWQGVYTSWGDALADVPRACEVSCTDRGGEVGRRW